MNTMKQSDLEELIWRSLEDFHVKRINELRTLKLRTVLRKKKPYLFRVVGVQKASEIVTEILRTHLTSSDRAFWEELTGDPDFYLKQIDLMRDYPIQHRIEFEKEWDKAINRFEYDFLINFGNEDGSINWDKLLIFNSGKEKPRWVKVAATTVVEEQDDNSEDTDDLDNDQE